MRVLAVAAAVGLLLSGTAAWAKKGSKLPPGEKCAASKLRAAGQLEVCMLVAEAKVVGTSGTPDFSSCDNTFSTKWAKIESKANGACPVTGDEASVQSQVSDDVSALASAISPGP